MDFTSVSHTNINGELVQKHSAIHVKCLEEIEEFLSQSCRNTGSFITQHLIDSLNAKIKEHTSCNNVQCKKIIDETFYLNSGIKSRWIFEFHFYLKNQDQSFNIPCFIFSQHGLSHEIEFTSADYLANGLKTTIILTANQKFFSQMQVNVGITRQAIEEVKQNPNTGLAQAAATLLHEEKAKTDSILKNW